MPTLTDAGLREIETSSNKALDVQFNFEELVKPTNGTFRIYKDGSNGIFWYAYNPDTTKWHKIMCRGTEGIVHFELEQTGVTLP